MLLISRTKSSKLCRCQCMCCILPSTLVTGQGVHRSVVAGPSASAPGPAASCSSLAPQSGGASPQPPALWSQKLSSGTGRWSGLRRSARATSSPSESYWTGSSSSCQSVSGAGGDTPLGGTSRARRPRRTPSPPTSTPPPTSACRVAADRGRMGACQGAGLASETYDRRAGRTRIRSSPLLKRQPWAPPDTARGCNPNAQNVRGLQPL